MRKAIIILTAICFLFGSMALIGCGKSEEPAPVKLAPKPMKKTVAPVAVKPVEVKKPAPPAPEELKMKKKPKKDAKKPAKAGGLKMKKKK